MRRFSCLSFSVLFLYIHDISASKLLPLEAPSALPFNCETVWENEPLPPYRNRHGVRGMMLSVIYTRTHICKCVYMRVRRHVNLFIIACEYIYTSIYLCVCISMCAFSYFFKKIFQQKCTIKEYGLNRTTKQNLPTKQFLCLKSFLPATLLEHGNLGYWYIPAIYNNSIWCIVLSLIVTEQNGKTIGAPPPQVNFVWWVCSSHKLLSFLDIPIITPTLRDLLLLYINKCMLGLSSAYSMTKHDWHHLLWVVRAALKVYLFK